MKNKHIKALIELTELDQTKMPVAFKLWHSMKGDQSKLLEELFVRSKTHQTSKMLARDFYKEIAIYLEM